MFIAKNLTNYFLILFPIKKTKGQSLLLVTYHLTYRTIEIKKTLLENRVKMVVKKSMIAILHGYIILAKRIIQRGFLVCAFFSCTDNQGTGHLIITSGERFGVTSWDDN